MKDYSTKILVLAVLGLVSPLVWAATTAEQRLAVEIARAATSRTITGGLSVEALEAATLLAQEAVRIDPDNPDLWRVVLELASLQERDDLRNLAVERLSQMDPADEVIRLTRLTLAIDRFQTVEERAAAYEKLLTDESIAKVGAAVASRLALDLALLHRRNGDIEKFSQRLRQATELDSSNRTAAAIAAGFFRMNVQDAVGQAELLVNLVLADPTDVSTQVTLAQLLLEHGAYVAADRMYRLAVHCSTASGVLPTNDLLADTAVAQWAVGDLQAALETLRKRQVDMDNYARQLKQRDSKIDISLLDLAKTTAPSDPTLATVAAAIHAGRADSEAASSFATVIAAYRDQIEAIHKVETDEKKVDASVFARVNLEMAWVTLWLGSDMTQALAFIKAAEEYQPLSDVAAGRFAGWMALREGDAAKAIELLEPLAASDVAARVGLAQARLKMGQAQDAARDYLAANRAQPGTLIGIWAATQLGNLLGQRVPLSEVAARLERLIASIPPQFDRYPTDASLALRFRLTASPTNFVPYEPIRFNIEITNTSLYPLGIDRDGPIRPQVLIVPTLRSANVPSLGEVKPFVVDIGRRLRLLPQETLSVSVNLRMYQPGELLNVVAFNGAIIRLKAQINFHANVLGAVETSAMGSEVDAPILRVDGERLSEDWVKDTVAAMQNVSSPGVHEQIALMSSWIAPRVRDLPPDPKLSREENQKIAEQNEQNRRIIGSVRTAFEEAFGKLDGPTQAWILSVMPAGVGPQVDGLKGTLDIARKSEHRLVKLAYLLFHAVGAQDPMYDAARRGDDPVLRRLAEMMIADAERAASRPASQPAGR